MGVWCSVNGLVLCAGYRGVAWYDMLQCVDVFILFVVTLSTLSWLATNFVSIGFERPDKVAVRQRAEHSFRVGIWVRLRIRIRQAQTGLVSVGIRLSVGIELRVRIRLRVWVRVRLSA